MSNTLIRSFNLPNGKVAFGMSIPCKGNGMTLGLTDGTNNVGLRLSSGEGYLTTSASSGYGSVIGIVSSSFGIASNNKLGGITTDPTKSGVVADLSDGQIVVIKY